MSSIGRTVRAAARAIAIAAGLAGSAAAGAASSSVQTIDVSEARALTAAGAAIVDVRRPDEWRTTGVVPGSRLITAFDAAGAPVPGFVDQVRAEVGAETPLVLICRSGNRSGKAAQLLTDQGGYTKLYNAAGGIIAWARAGAPLEPCPSC